MQTRAETSSRISNRELKGLRWDSALASKPELRISNRELKVNIRIIHPIDKQLIGISNRELKVVAPDIKSDLLEAVLHLK